MSIELTQEEIKKKITVIRKMIIVLQQWLALILKNRPVVVLHWTATSRDTTHWQAIENAHKGYPTSKKGYHTAYNTLIEGSGKTFRSREYTETGQATGTFNGFHLDICLTGTIGESPTQEQIPSLKNELLKIEKIYGSYVLEPHSKYYPTECPGDVLRAWIKGHNKINK